MSEGWAALGARGRNAHPELALAPEAFAAFLAGALPCADPAALDALAIEDLFLACACAESVPGAAAKFEARYGGTMKRAVARVLSEATDREEAVQKTRQLLLAGQPPKLAQYRGEGPLAHWVSVAAIRVALSAGRSQSAERRLRQEIVVRTIGADNPELRFIKAELRDKLELAITDALERLGGRERLLLRLRFVSGMSATAIGRTFDVNHSTIVRRLQRIRERLLADVMRSLAATALGATDLASIVGAVGSQIDVSISRLLPPE